MSVIRYPDLSARPFRLSVEHTFPLSASALYDAWTKRFDLWFAAPGSVWMHAEVNTPFFFETEYKPENQTIVQRHPHYGRFLKLVPNELVQLTWVTGAEGTEGAETVVTVEFSQKDAGRTYLRLTHEGFATESAKNRHERAWPMVFEQLEKKLIGTNAA